VIEARILTAYLTPAKDSYSETQFWCLAGHFENENFNQQVAALGIERAAAFPNRYPKSVFTTY